MRILITRDDPAAMARGMALVKLYTDDDEVLCHEVPDDDVNTMEKAERFVRALEKELLKAHGCRWLKESTPHQQEGKQ